MLEGVGGRSWRVFCWGVVFGVYGFRVSGFRASGLSLEVEGP